MAGGKRWAAGGAAAALVVAIGLGVSARNDAIARELLPPLPDLTGRPAAMIAHLRDADAAARRSPRSPAAVGALGIAYHADLFYAPAAQAYARATELDAGNPRWRYNLALLHVERGEAALVADALRAVVTTTPQNTLAWLRLGDAEFKRARFREADEAYSHAGQEPAVAVYALMGRARIAMQAGDLASASERLERAVAAAPRHGSARRLLGEVYRLTGRAADAERAIRRAAALDAFTAPPDPAIRELARESRNSVFLLKQIGAADARTEREWREWLARRATEVDPDNPDVIYELGSLLQQMGRTREAVSYFSRHLDMVEDDQQTLVQLGKCYADLGDRDAAEGALRRALAVSDDAVGWYNLGFVMEQRGREQEGEALYRKALTVDPNLAPAHTNLATLLARRGRFDEAMAHARTVVRLHPARADGYNNLGAMLLQSGKADEAEPYLREALEIDPASADAQANMGIVLAQRGRFAEALRHFDEALRLDPAHGAARANRAAVVKSQHSDHRSQNKP